MLLTEKASQQWAAVMMVFYKNSIENSLCKIVILGTTKSFVELGGGVGDVLVWSREEAYVEFGFR